jgi:hypothetical protein
MRLRGIEEEDILSGKTFKRPETKITLVTEYRLCHVLSQASGTLCEDI